MAQPTLTFALPQVASFKMAHVLLYLSAHVFIMAHHMYKDMCFNKDVVFGECGDKHFCKSRLVLWQPAVKMLCVFSVCMGGVWNCTENNCTGEFTLSEQSVTEGEN